MAGRYGPNLTMRKKKNISIYLLTVLLLGACVTGDLHREPESTGTEATGASEPAATIPPRASEISFSAVEPAPLIWPQVRAGFRLQVPDDKRVLQHIRWFEKHPEYIERVLTRADPYLYLILQQVRARDLPAEIVLLPIVESGFRPFAYSHGRAAGLWQFIPGTAKRFGLKQNWWYDGRRDVVASTRAALDYLVYLHKYFDGDWLLALAAYNSGEGTVSRAVKRNRKAGKPAEFWHLKLPRETRAYVPRLLALARIVESPRRYGLELHPIENRPRLVNVPTGGQIDLALVSELADIPLDKVYELNPGFNRWATDPAGPHHLLLPVETAIDFTVRLSRLPAGERVQWERHKVTNGQTLSHVARKYRTTVAVLKDVNEMHSDRIRAGQYLLIPVASKGLEQYTLSADERRRKTAAKRRSGSKTTHTVRTGDTLWDLSRKYKVNLRSLASWNSMAPTDTLRTGQKLVVWHKGKTTGSGRSLQSIHYTVRKGDSLHRISARFKVSVNDLVKWNRIQRNAYLQPGQRLKLFVDVREQTDS